MKKLKSIENTSGMVTLEGNFTYAYIFKLC